MREDGGVIARAGANMHHVLAGGGQGLMDEMGMQRRLPVVDAALGHERDQIVGIEIDGVGVGCRHIVA